MHSKRPPVGLDEAAVYLGVTARWMRHAVAERRLPYLKVGRLLRFDLDDLDNYLKTVRVEAGGSSYAS